jgi:hypothetical protein
MEKLLKYVAEDSLTTAFNSHQSVYNALQLAEERCKYTCFRGHINFSVLTSKTHRTEFQTYEI